MENNWTEVISPKKGLFQINIKEIWQYRDLIQIFVKRDIIAVYKQTILGPLWFFLGPLFTVATFVLIFNKIAGISTDGIPAPIFYLAGVTLWNYFQTCFTGTSNTFVSNAAIFGKVYFPRLISPISTVLSNLFKFFIQLLLFVCFLGYYIYKNEVSVNWTIITLPLLILIMAILALGFGLIISSLTSKYRDLSYFISFGVSLLMYATPVIYPSSAIPSVYAKYLSLNPLAPVIENFRYSVTSHGSYDFLGILYSSVFSLFILAVGIVLFNRVEKNFIDTV